MKKYLPSFFIFFLSFFVFFVVGQPTHADELDDITKKINELNQALSNSKAATAPLESQLKTMVAQINDIKNRIVGIENDVAAKKKSINVGYEKMAQQQEELNDIIRTVYTDSYYANPLLTLLLPFDASDRTKQLMYQQAITDQNKQKLTTMALVIQDLETKKRNLEDEEKRLATAKASLDEQSAKLDKTVAGAKTYQSELSSQIAQLSAQQQQFIAAKQGSLNIPLYAYTTQGGCSSDLKNGKDPGFSGGFGFFTYGVPNRVGLNQYGAWGRAKAGQNSDTILRAYYNFDGYQNMDTTINVNDSNGYNSGNIIWTGSLEDYMKRIWEVPDSWADNDLAALKAQAIAARSYVLAQTDNGNKSICANTYCQVFKPDPKGGNWEQAVTQTANQVMVQGGKPITAYFSSTHGGYVYQSGGDISSRPWLKNAQDASSTINSFADLQNNAYDKDSPWFYCDWGGRSQYGGTAWLKPEEVADIVNVILLTRKDGSLRKHLYQTDKSNPEGTDTWDAKRVRQELGSAALSSVSDISVSADFGSGQTTNIVVNGQSFSASEFRDFFNLRAPANINIVGPLYNVERK